MNTAAKVADKALGPVPTSTTVQPKVDEEHKMYVLTWQGKKDIRYLKVPKPLITDPTDIILRVTATTICGSDLHLYSGNFPDMHEGDILGHEFMGLVEEVGPAVKKLKVGQRVVVAFDITCGKCQYCKREEYTACETTNPSRLMEKMYGHRIVGIYGYSHLTGGYPGGQSEFVRVPFADNNCLAIPDDVPDDKALYLSDVVTTSYHGTELADVRRGSKVGIWGLGPIGLLTAKWCQIRGAKNVDIVGIDCVPYKLKAAEKLGIKVINFKEEDAVKKIFEYFPGGLDCGIECAGYDYAKSITHKIERAVNLETDTPEILTEIIYVVRPFGRVAIIGDYTGFANQFPIGAMMEKHLYVSGGQSPTQKYWPMALEKIRTGEFDPTFIVTHRGSLASGPEFYKLMYERQDGFIKCFLRPEAFMQPPPVNASQ